MKLQREKHEKITLNYSDIVVGILFLNKTTFSFIKQALPRLRARTTMNETASHVCDRLFVATVAD